MQGNTFVGQGSRGSVFQISRNHGSGMGQLHAYLMRAAGKRTDAQQIMSARRSEQFIVEAGRFAALPRS